MRKKFRIDSQKQRDVRVNFSRSHFNESICIDGLYAAIRFTAGNGFMTDNISINPNILKGGDFEHHCALCRDDIKGNHINPSESKDNKFRATAPRMTQVGR
jgi:hypothetical protein